MLVLNMEKTLCEVHHMIMKSTGVSSQEKNMFTGEFFFTLAGQFPPENGRELMDCVLQVVYARKQGVMTKMINNI